jgi:hypothetical protein
MTDAPPRRIGLPWYNREDYLRIRDMMTDRHNLASTYDSCAKWCTEKGLEPDSAARIKYVAEMSAQTTA